VARGAPYGGGPCAMTRLAPWLIRPCGGQPGGNGDGLRVRDTDNSTAVDDLPTATPTCHLSSWRIVESRNHDRQSLRQTDGGRQTSSADAFELTDRAVWTCHTHTRPSQLQSFSHSSHKPTNHVAMGDLHRSSHVLLPPDPSDLTTYGYHKHLLYAFSSITFRLRACVSSIMEQAVGGRLPQYASAPYKLTISSYSPGGTCSGMLAI